MTRGKRKEKEMERVTLRMPVEMVRQLELLADDGLYPNRSEAIRSYVRDGLEDEDVDPEEELRRRRVRRARL